MPSGGQAGGRQRWPSEPYSGTALSNVFDRLRIGAVGDYLDIHAWDHEWPAFNFADAAIVCGVAILVLETLWAVRMTGRISENFDNPASRDFAVVALLDHPSELSPKPE